MFIPVNYLKQWKCAAVLKPDGSQLPQDQSSHILITEELDSLRPSTDDTTVALRQNEELLSDRMSIENVTILSEKIHLQNLISNVLRCCHLKWWRTNNKLSQWWRINHKSSQCWRTDNEPSQWRRDAHHSTVEFNTSSHNITDIQKSDRNNFAQRFFCFLKSGKALEVINYFRI